MRISSYILLLVIGLTAVNALRAQRAPYPKNEAALRALHQELTAASIEREARVATFLQREKTVNRAFEIDGTRYFLHDVVNGHPQYFITHNDGSARSMGLPDLRPGGKFGLNITGAGIRVGVWDAGIALRTHQEYGGRLLNNDSGTDVDDHACHVVGTLIAGGIDPRAQGMLYQAQASAYDWNQDFEEMVSESLNSDLLVSNHSYGFGAGWENGNWLGDPSISNEEDYRFGFYGSRSRTVDNIAFNAPYYSMFKSAGNDRGDSGNGVQPPDGPFDCIGDWGTAKNVFTIGAVRKLSGEYSGPASIIMSGFSSWGPVDDGRIKPDFVAPGVSLYSPISGANDAYGSLSGTSMASPSAAGAVMAVNEAYRLFHNTYLRSATLKALMVQTAYEAGNAPGPDYSFGWGMINASAAVDLISRKDDINNFVIESTLLNKDSFVLELSPIAGRKITATIAWTDPPGSSPAPALDPTDLMLVNDLDMRIVDEVGNSVSPWILDPQVPGKPAARGDNFRDNIEKIEFDNPQPRKYFLVIKHKGDLQNGRQDFSLILQYQSEDPGLQNLYWVNDDGQWSDTDRWSDASGGNTASLSPQSNSKLIFDNNSFSQEVNTVTIDQDYEVAGIVSLNNRQVTFDLGGNTLTVSGSVIIGSPNFNITNGTIVLRNTATDQTYNIDLDRTQTSDLEIVVAADNQAQWSIGNSTVSLDRLAVHGGALLLDNTDLQVDELLVDNEGTMEVSNSRLIDPNLIEIRAPGGWSDDFNSSIVVNAAGEALTLDAPAATVNARIVVTENALILTGPAVQINQLELNAATLDQRSNAVVFSLIASGGSQLQLAGGTQLEILQELELNTQTGKRISLANSDPANRATIVLTPHEKFCFDQLDIIGIDLGGPASVSIGINSTLSDADNWFVGACEQLLFADFDVQYACVGSLARFIDSSDGNIAAYRWYVDDELVSNESLAEYVFTTAGNYLIRLEIEDPTGQVTDWQESISVIESEIPDNRIVQNATQLASFNLADSYQWYKNGEPIPGETGRVYRYNGEAAIYFVVTFEGNCNKQSEVLDLLGTNVRNLDRGDENLVDIYPVPVNDELIIRRREGSFRQLYLRLHNAYGQTMYQAEMGAGNRYRVDLSGYSPGVYLLILDTGDQILTKKIIKQ